MINSVQPGTLFTHKHTPTKLIRMKFEETLRSHLTAEWRSQYITYGDLKEMLEEYKTGAPRSDADVDERLIDREYSKFKEKFFQTIESELLKVNTFFEEQLNANNRKLRQLNTEADRTKKIQNISKSQNGYMSASKESKTEGDTNTWLYSFNRNHENKIQNESSGLNNLLNLPRFKKKSLRDKTIKEIKSAFCEYYLGLILLQKYQELNFTGFRKILKKYDKITNTSDGKTFVEKRVEVSGFHVNKTVDQLILEVENTMTELEGDRSIAMNRLRVPPLERSNQSSDDSLSVIFRFGLNSGIALVCIVLTMYYGWHHVHEIDFLRACWYFRCPWWLWIFVLLLGVNIYAFRTYGVNHILIFEIDPRNHINHEHFYEIGSFLAIIWAISFNLYLYHDQIFCWAPEQVCGLESINSENLTERAGVFGRHSDMRRWKAEDCVPFVDYIQCHDLREYIPKLVYFLYTIFLFNPLNFGYRSARYWLIRRTYRCLVAGLFPVEFADFWLADQFCSLGVIFTDIARVGCQFLHPLPLNAAAAFYYNEKESDMINKINASSSYFHLHANETCINGKFVVVDDTSLLTPKITLLSCECQSFNVHIVTILASIPALMRFVQCLRRYYDSGKWYPHLVNGGKYATGICNILLSSLYLTRGASMPWIWYFYIIGNVINSCYVFIWDIKMDWGFCEGLNKKTDEEKMAKKKERSDLERNNNSDDGSDDKSQESTTSSQETWDKKLLRAETVYGNPWIYCYAIIQNFVIRFRWIIYEILMIKLLGPRGRLAHLPSHRQERMRFVVNTVQSSLEIWRRFCWNFFRLENEHLNNCGEFRAVRDISIAPIKDDDIVKLEKMMDRSAGVRNRSKKGEKSGK